MSSELDTAIFWTNQLQRVGKSYLEKEGWFNMKPQSESGPTPWFTYPAISFLKDVITKEAKVFEYGAGFSTLFFLENAKECHSVDHNQIWVDKIQGATPKANVVYAEECSMPLPQGEAMLNEFLSLNFECPKSEDKTHNIEHGLLNQEFAKYASEITKWEKGHFDMVVVDGMARILSGFYAAEYVAADGYIILDNSDRWQYNSLQQHLAAKGFGRVDFWGLGAVNHYPWCTSFFSKSFKIKNIHIDRPHKSGDLGW